MNKFFIKLYKKSKNEIKFLFLLLLIFTSIIIPNIVKNIKVDSNKIKRVGVINLPIGLNIGNMLVKYSMFKKLEELGVNATIITPKIDPLNFDFSFLKETLQSHLLFVNQSFLELNEKDFDYLMVNSDETWHCVYDKIACDNIAFLKFARYWNVKKFIYAASEGRYCWPFENHETRLIKILLKKFSGISFREKGMIKILEDNIGLKSEFVLDPTFLLDKQYYLNITKNNKYFPLPGDKFIFIYQLDENQLINQTIKKINKTFNFKLIQLPFDKKGFIENFIYGINNSHAVITDSFHGTVFSIIFNKPFISFINEDRGNARFYSLKKIFDLKDRIIEPSSGIKIDINLLIKPLNINQSVFTKLKNFSIDYLKRNLDIVN